MIDVITLNCPSCKGLAIQKEGDFLKVRIKNQSLKHPEDRYESSLPVFTCTHCEKQFVIERVNKY